MATKKDLVEAHAFSRRRLVTAFVSGAPGGREVEPARPLRAVIGGAALCVLLLAGAAIAGFFVGRAPDGWNEPGALVASKERGTLFYVEGSGEDGGIVLRPFVNATSAQIFLGSDVEPQRTSQDVIDSEELGPQIGIPGAPTSIPTPERLVQSDWTACTTSGRGILTSIGTGEVSDSDEPPAPVGSRVEGGAKVVSAGGATHVIADNGVGGANSSPDAQAFTLPSGSADSILQTLGLPLAAEATEVDPGWLNLFEVVDVDPSQISVGSGQQQVGGSQYSAGTLLTSGGSTFLVTSQGVAPMSPFALAVYKSKGVAEPQEVSTTPSLIDPDDVYPASWPTDPLVDVPGDACAQLVTEPGERSTLQLVGDVPEEARSGDVTKGSTAVVVGGGRGAFVTSGGFDATSGSSTWLVDSTGKRYPIADDDTRANLGFAEIEPALLPGRWISLLDTGVSLSAAAAGKSPGNQ